MQHTSSPEAFKEFIREAEAFAARFSWMDREAFEYQLQEKNPSVYTRNLVMAIYNETAGAQ
jgi:hypothetical protein